MVRVGARWEESVSCGSVGNPAESSTFMQGGRSELATFFREMIIRHIITGMNLSTIKPISPTPVIVRAGIVSHSVSPADGKQRIVISEKQFSQIAGIRATHNIGMVRNPGCESGSNGQHASNLGSGAKNPTLAATSITTIKK